MMSTLSSRRVVAIFLSVLAVWTVSNSTTKATTLKSGNLVAIQASNGINGVIFDELRHPVPNMWVELLDEVNTVLTRVRTDAVGRFSFNRLSNGTFQVKVITFGTNYISQMQRVNLVSASMAGGRGSHYENIDIYLKADRKREENPGSAGPIFAQDVPEPARKLYDQAVSMLNSGKNSKDGISKLKEAIDIFPTYYMALERMGVEYVRVEDYDPAKSALDKAIEVNPKGYNSFYALGVLQYRLKQYPECVESLRKVVLLAPDSGNAPFARYHLGMAYLKTGKSADAETHLKKAYEQGGKNVPSDVHMGLAQIYSSSKRYKEAAAELELYIRETPDARDTDKIKLAIKQLKEKK
ncbi:MAG: tetratricopeptide repeat protein [Acidobacteria bacterium]|nr:tetratricopeptide repeat protein [Acidobacteriota bacterium]